MTKPCIVFSSRYLNHEPSSGHPESPKRLKAIMDSLRSSSILRRECRLVEPDSASLSDLQLVHESDYISMVKRVCEHGGGPLDLGDTMTSPKSYEVAKLAVGGVLVAARKAFGEEAKNGFAFVRPPGHHAGPSYALGFCIFNNVAIAATYLIRNLGLRRILILDIDAHHGNGTQEIFYQTNEILYVSLHMHPLQSFPGTGFPDETGKDEGRGYTVNIPFPLGTGDSAYWKAFKSIVIPIVFQYKPEFILVSAGFDGYYRDHVAGLSLSAHIYSRIFRSILEMSRKTCNGRVVAVLEGGYKLGFLKKAAVATVAQMAGLTYRLSDRRPIPNHFADKTAQKGIEEVKRVQSSFWSL